jgi:hypothetical protein
MWCMQPAIITVLCYGVDSRMHSYHTLISHNTRAETGKSITQYVAKPPPMLVEDIHRQGFQKSASTFQRAHFLCLLKQSWSNYKESSTI